MTGQADSLEATLAALDEPQAREALRPLWPQALAAMPKTVPDFLQPESILENRRWCGFDDSVDAFLLAAAQKITADQNLLRLAWCCHYALYETEVKINKECLPVLAKSLGREFQGGFYLLLGLAFVPLMRRRHAGWSIPEKITRDTCAEVFCFCDSYRRGQNGRWGIFPHQIYWLRHYVDGNRYFRIGRFEYWLKNFFIGLKVFRHISTGETLALAKDGGQFSAAGFVLSDPNDDPGGLGWKTTFTAREAGWEGWPISPFGHAVRKKVFLPKSEWRLALSSGFRILDMHIPSGGGMSPEAYTASMLAAAAFFQKYFPDEPPVAFFCNSWMFNTQLEEILPPEANLVRFMREVYLFPVPSSGNDGLWFLFLQEHFDPKTAPRQTSLQRAVLEYLAKGHRWRGGGMFYLLEDLQHFGTQHYRKNWNSAKWACPYPHVNHP